MSVDYFGGFADSLGWCSDVLTQSVGSAAGTIAYLDSQRCLWSRSFKVTTYKMVLLTIAQGYFAFLRE